MPMNTNTVISMVSRTCARRLFSGIPAPPKKLALASAGCQPVRLAIRRNDYRAAAGYMSRASDAGLPREKMQEANELQMRIARGMNNR